MNPQFENCVMDRNIGQKLNPNSTQEVGEGCLKEAASLLSLDRRSRQFPGRRAGRVPGSREQNEQGLKAGTARCF